MTFYEFNLRFLAELNRYRRDLKHLGSGSARHPLLRKVLLSAVKEDIRIDGFEAAFQRWQHFVEVNDDS